MLGLEAVNNLEDLYRADVSDLDRELIAAFTLEIGANEAGAESDPETADFGCPIPVCDDFEAAVDEMMAAFF